MMDYQHKLFIANFNLEKRVRANHPLRNIRKKIDFDFIYDEVKNTYGLNGNISVPPPVILKMMLLLVLYNVRSERELMDTIPERNDWLWFLGYDLEDEIPNHSVLSKARTRWGVGAFKKFFENVLWQCVEEGLVDGCKVFVDSSLIDADASNNSVVDMKRLEKHLNKSYQLLEERLDDLEEYKTTPVNKKFISTTDPDASVTRYVKGKSKLRYKTHRAVDEKHEVITATKVTPGSVDDGKVLDDMMDLHEQNTQKKIDTVVADTKYGTVDNFLNCYDQGIKTHNVYKAPAKVCNDCQLKNKCTRSRFGRTLKRHARQDELDVIVAKTKTRESKRDLKTRQHLSERSFANATQYSYKRARWRKIWRMEIQDFLIAAIQNIKVLINQPKQRMSKSNVMECRRSGILSLNRLENWAYDHMILLFYNFMFSFKTTRPLVKSD